MLVPSGEMERARELLKSVPQEEPPGNGIAVTLEPNTEGAHCAVHGQHATQACKRCGNFLCERCDGADAGLCEDCADLKDSNAQVQRGRKRKVVAWLILLFMFGPLLLIILSNLLFALLH
ncbi:hypothetical protein [Corallococcus exercitus]|uniref:Uncharacterized protein n=1 Tax=Corallococcus exercitus TaxID=2316736 RepID=A0A7Y4JRL8_9BACT|nr:hypothetical protein [Corallococcus exercitus]NOK08947.1 hypothetical protein [Corallococcus exercitus]